MKWEEESERGQEHEKDQDNEGIKDGKERQTG
jgi:hypothetical protein